MILIAINYYSENKNLDMLGLRNDHFPIPLYRALVHKEVNIA